MNLPWCSRPTAIVLVTVLIAYNDLSNQHEIPIRVVDPIGTPFGCIPTLHSLFCVPIIMLICAPALDSWYVPYCHVLLFRWHTLMVWILLEVMSSPHFPSLYSRRHRSSLEPKIVVQHETQSVVLYETTILEVNPTTATYSPSSPASPPTSTTPPSGSPTSSVLKLVLKWCSQNYRG